MKRISLRIALTLPFLVLPGGAAASDTKVLPATICQPEVGSSHRGTYLFGAYDYSNASFPNGHKVTCPIVRDATDSVLTEVRVHFGHTNLGSDTITCRIQSQADDGSSRDTSDPKSHTSSSSGEHEFVFAIDALDHFNGGTFAVQCTMNMGLRLIGVRYTED